MAKRIDSTPRKDGYRMPGEFEPQEKIWMIWPERPDNWRDGAKPAARGGRRSGMGRVRFAQGVIVRERGREGAVA